MGRFDNQQKPRRRLPVRFGLRSLLLLVGMVAVLLAIIPWLETVGLVAYCSQNSSGKKLPFRAPAFGSSSCTQCHDITRSDLRPWITFPPEYRIPGITGRRGGESWKK